MTTSFSFLKDRKNPDVMAKRLAALAKRREGLSGDRDYIFTKKLPRFKIKDGGAEHCIRILPPSWEGATDYGIKIYSHYNIGLHKSSFLCLENMNGQPCPICEEIRKNANDKDIEKIKPRYGFLMWVIDRQEPNIGPKLWSAPIVIEREAAQSAYDKKTDTSLFYEDVDNGYDINFIVNGKIPYVKYVGIKPDRNPSPLGDPEQIEKWLKFVEENPLPSILLFKDYTYISNVMQGIPSGGIESTKSEEVLTTEKVVYKSELKLVQDEPKKEFAKTEPKSESNSKLDSSRIQKMNRNEVIGVINSLQLSIAPEEWEDTDDLKEAVKVELGLN